MKSNKVKRILATLMLSTMVLGQASTVSAAGKNFGKSWTTTPREERLQDVCQKAKADNEQRWYITLTKVGGLGTAKSNKNGNALAVSQSPGGVSAPIPLFSNDLNRTKSQGYYKGAGAKKGKVCHLLIGGNSNNTKRYKLNLKGRYSS